MSLKNRNSSFIQSFLPDQKNFIALALLLGAVCAIFPLVTIYLLYGGAAITFIEKSRPWTLITGIAATPALILMWHWRENNKRADIHIEQESLFTSRFTTAINLLGNKKMEIRLGGIYALSRLSRDSKKDYRSVMETLSAFVRKKCTLSSIRYNPPSSPNRYPGNTHDNWQSNI